MNRRTLLAAFSCLLLGQSFAHGQRQTERFIPIGRSPGVSGKHTRIGTVAAADRGARTFELATPEGRVTVRVAEGAPIWLDRSRRKLGAVAGGFDDLKADRRVEVKYADAGRTGPVEWIKIEVAE